MTTTAKRPPAKKTTTKKTVAKVSSPADFKKRKRGTPIELPSGLVVVARRVDVKDFILNNYDVPNPLMEIMTAALDKGKQMDISKMTGLDKDEVDLNMVKDMYEMVDAMLKQIVVEPQVHENPKADEEDENLVYCRDFEDEDKMFLFQWAIGGTSDLATFRSELATGMASLDQGQKSQGPAKRTAGPRPK